MQSIEVNGVNVVIEKDIITHKNNNLMLKVRQSQLMDILMNSNGSIKLFGSTKDFAFVGNTTVRILK